MPRRLIAALAIPVSVLAPLIGCTSDSVESPNPTPSLPALETSDHTSANEVLLEGVLAIQPEGCVTIAGISTVWPTGTTLEYAEDEIVLVDQNGAVRAVVGDAIKVGGGPLGSPDGGTVGCEGDQKFGVTEFMD